MKLKKLLPQKPNTQTVILGIAFLSAYLMSTVSSSQAGTLPSMKASRQGTSYLETPLLMETAIPTETPTVASLLLETATKVPGSVTMPFTSEAKINQYPSGQGEISDQNDNFSLFLPYIQRAPWKKIIENQDFTQTLNLDTGDDDTLILNATFHNIAGSAITLRNVSNVYIRNCIIHDVAEDGIVLRSTGSTHNVTIEGCTIYNTGHNGIISKQQEETGVDHTGLIIKNNTLYNIGTTELDHGMYIFSTGSVIQHNVVHGTTGNGVSLRSSSLVQGNKVWDTGKSCIRYYNDHAPGVSNILTIENNLCYQAATRTGAAGISLSIAETAPESWLVETYTIRFNTVVLLTAGRYAFVADSSAFDSKRVEVYGNLFVNTQDILKTLKADYVDYQSRNFKTTDLTEFLNPNQLLDGFQPGNDSGARFYASGEPNFPAVDINETLRPGEYLDAGAYQVSLQPALASSGETPAVTEGSVVVE